VPPLSYVWHTSQILVELALGELPLSSPKVVVDRKVTGLLAPPGKFVVGELGAVMVVRTRLILVVLSVWHVAQTKAPYLPPATPHDPDHFVDWVVLELCRRPPEDGGSE
jgi:hypothetical protein